MQKLDFLCEETGTRKIRRRVDDASDDVVEIDAHYVRLQRRGKQARTGVVQLIFENEEDAAGFVKGKTYAVTVEDGEA